MKDKPKDRDYLEMRAQLVKDASQRGRPRPITAADKLPEEISPYMGLDPDTARELAELFPAPNPDIVAARRLRQAQGPVSKNKYQAVMVVIPKEVLYVTGMRKGDLVLVSGWHHGIIRLVRVPEGENG